ncbi:MAG: 2-C-methyl-D-erythritol 2,4-cyclodiphosphate synthase [Clostridiales Family XIII bacterium]|jgi:2-C-methyl-D-erythritol 2,4-cyclodiphosphate synthase/2-C-methyl-D-erythritol 4-phosphate cytidylyltransferase|nr:2-C-methyl-D-erythritol 2,4-cyclodiphosphate synthase [Clostridiales Family XIII bacterium]
MYSKRKVTALIMAAGNGSRLGAGAPKQFLDIGGESMILRAARAFEECGYVDGIMAVSSRERRAETDDILGVLPKYRGSASGADSRQESVRLGLRALKGARRAGGSASEKSEEAEIVLIHDAARPFVTQDVIARVLAGVAMTGAAVACVHVTDTIYRAVGESDNPLLAESPPRGLLWSVQTPQGFDLDMILSAHEAAAADGFEATDDGAVARAYGYAADRAAPGGQDVAGERGADVLIAMGDYANRKITTPDDMIAAAKNADSSGGSPHTAPAAAGTDVAEARADDRVGAGFDVHAFAPEEEGRPLVLGGVAIPYARGLEGHSDADVLTHALMDAMLGALALGDIGKVFPDTDEKRRGISSMKLLSEVRALTEGKGYTVYNVDATIIAEKPRMAEHTDDMRSSLATALGIDRDRVSVKATTTEGLGFTGREEGIGAQAVARLVKK